MVPFPCTCYYTCLLNFRAGRSTWQWLCMIGTSRKTRIFWVSAKWTCSSADGSMFPVTHSNSSTPTSQQAPANMWVQWNVRIEFSHAGKFKYFVSLNSEGNFVDSFSRRKSNTKDQNIFKYLIWHSYRISIILYLCPIWIAFLLST